MKTFKFTIGADPEMFFRNNEELISVINKIGGSKQVPMDIGNGCAIQEDNVAAEFCIPPASDVTSFKASIMFAMSDLQARAEKLGLTLAELTASGEFSKEQLKSRKAREFGCDPDYNAWTLDVNPRPRANNPFLRSAGGHVHIGTDKDAIEVVRCADLMLGVPSVLLDPDTERRKLYGKAGCFRQKPYGVEYRTLSNFWIWKEKTIEWVYHQVESLIDLCDDFNRNATDEERKSIVDCINNNDRATAERLVKTWEIALP